jgi:PTH1 family peptidyl-tRNA hydrolase
MNDRLVMGLGNPGKQYLQTRHNIGFAALDHFVQKFNADFSPHARIPGLVAEWKHNGTKWIAIKPITFMNLSGQAVTAALNFWKIELPHLMVLVDDMSVPLGNIRIREAGSAGGHNGLKSIIEQLGTRGFPRLRLGIGHPPASIIKPADWVLQAFDNSELPFVEDSVKRCASALQVWTDQGVAAAMTQFNVVNSPPVSQT